MHDEMMAAKSEAYYDGNAKQLDVPRITMEMDLLDKYIEIASNTAETLVARLDRIMRPDQDAEVRAMDGTPTREPSQHAASLMSSSRRVQMLTSLLQDAVERLEI